MRFPFYENCGLHKVEDILKDLNFCEKFEIEVSTSLPSLSKGQMFETVDVSLYQLAYVICI